MARSAEVNQLSYILEYLHLYELQGVDAPAHVAPFPFGRICFMVLVMRKGGESR